MTDDKNVKNPLVTQEGAVTIVSINKPPWNPMSMEFFDKLERLISKLATDQSVRAIVITAEGEDNFSVGMDLKQMAKAGGKPKRMHEILDQRLRVESVIENMGKPVIATLFDYAFYS